MPHTPVSSDTSSTLSLPQFIQHIKDSMGLSPKQAMELLKVRTLTGVNLRDALEQLQNLISHSTNVPALSSPSHSPTGAKITSIEQHRDMLGTADEKHSPTAFDEEIYLEQDQKEAELDDLDLSPELTPQERMRARELLDKFHESRGPTVASAARLQVLENVTSSEISPEQLQQLAQYNWGLASRRNHKVDQVEVLNYCAKEDDVQAGVVAVLALLEEERYARGNR